SMSFFHFTVRLNLDSPKEIKELNIFRVRQVSYMHVADPLWRLPMITAIVQILLPKPINSQEAARAFELTAPIYQGLRGLIRKYYLRSEDRRHVGGVYLWETRVAAEAVYSVDWKARVKQLYGAEPEITWFETPVIVDNQAGGAITGAA